MQEPLVSVHMITYNHAPYIAQAIEGVLMQKTSFPFELVIGEDCSTDGTRQIVFEYAKRYPDIIRVITSDKNVGMKKNSNRVSEACRGKYIAWCEGDDYWHRDDKLQMQVDYLEAHPECGLVHGEIDLLNLFDGKITKRYHESQGAVNIKMPDDLFYEIFLGHYLIRTCTVCLRKDMFIDIIKNDPEVFQTGRFLMGDTPLWLEMSRLCKFHYIDETLAVYRKHEGGVSGLKDRTKYVRFELSVLDMLMYYLKKYDYVSKVPRAYLDKHANNILGYTFDAMDFQLAEKAKKIRGVLSPKLWLLYYGSKVRLMNSILKPFVKMKRMLYS